MTKYRTRSANILNEADRFEDIMNWRTFAEEQDMLLYSKPDDWVPGWPMDLDPRERYEDEETGGQEVRPMFELIDDVEVNYWYPWVSPWSEIRCNPCQVGWRGDDPCFSCGEVVPSRFDQLRKKHGTRPRQEFFRGRLVGDRIEPVVYNATDEAEGVTEWIQREMRIRFDEEMARHTMWISTADNTLAFDVEEFRPEDSPPAWTGLLEVPARPERLRWLPDYEGVNQQVNFSMEPVTLRGEEFEGVTRFFGYDPSSFSSIGYMRQSGISFVEEPEPPGLLDGVDLSVRQEIEPPVINRGNPTLERYLERERHRNARGQDPSSRG